MSSNPEKPPSVKSGTLPTATLKKAKFEITKTEFVFRNPYDKNGELPIVKESWTKAKKEEFRQKEYAKRDKWGSRILDRRLREKTVITFNVINLGKTDEIEYKIHLVKNVRVVKENKEDKVKYDDVEIIYNGEKEDKFRFFKDDKWHKLTKDSHYWELWNLKFKGHQKLDLIKGNIEYTCKIVTRDKSKPNQDEIEWFSDTIKIKYDPFKVTIICKPMTNKELEGEKIGGHFISEKGERPNRDSWIEVYRGKRGTDAVNKIGESILVGRFKAMMMPTGTKVETNIETPKNQWYYGHKSLHRGYGCLELETKLGKDNKKAKIDLPVGCINQPKPENGRRNFKDYVHIHTVNVKHRWTTSKYGSGCIILPHKQKNTNRYGVYGDSFDNYQQQSKKHIASKKHHDNSHSIMAAIFGGYDNAIIPKLEKRKKKLTIKTWLGAAKGDEYSLYRSIHQDIIQEFKCEMDGDKFKITFRTPRGILRAYPPNELNNTNKPEPLNKVAAADKSVLRNFAIENNTKFRWYITRKDSNNKYETIRIIIGKPDAKGEISFEKLKPGQHDWSWDGQYKPKGSKTFQRVSPGKYYSIIETKFNANLKDYDKDNNFGEDQKLKADGSIGGAWWCEIEVPTIV